MKKIKYLFFVLLSFFAINYTYAQCEVTANINPAVICAGEAVTLTATGGCGTYLMSNDFNNGTPAPGWVATTGVDFTNPCGLGPDSIYLWMGNQVPIPRTLTTVPLNVIAGCLISFWLRFEIQTAQPGTCEGPDLVGEGVSLQYSTDAGTTYTDIAYFRPDGEVCPSYPNTNGFTTILNGMATAFTTWAQYQFAIPPAAQSPNTIFRWRQHA